MTTAPLSPRELFEQRHRLLLAPYAVSEADSGGRKCAETPHVYRTCFQRDRDRIIHSSAFRRLDFKTQVFVPHEHDHFRTRMTHTIEVAQIGRNLARALGLNEDLVEAVALAHDLGHPPFGHAGEAALNERMAQSGYFEHNRQSLRVVDYLEHPYPQFRGLNLTNVLRECLAKHQTRYDTPICEDFDTKLNAPLEGQLCDLADEIAYTSADLDDALQARWLELGQLESLTLWQQAHQRAAAEAPGARPVHVQIRAVKNVLAILADDLIQTTLDALRDQNVTCLQDARLAQRRCVGFSPNVRRALDQMQDFLLKNVYLYGANADREAASRKIIGMLFDAYVSKPTLLPPRYASRVQTDGLPRVVCDYIAGMTDRFCRKQYADLIGLPLDDADPASPNL